jgi:hypothetical protein
MLYNGKTVLLKIEGTRGWQESLFEDEILGMYQFEIWRELHSRMRAETFLFFHYGAVGETIGRIEGRDWHPSYGLGIRLSRPTALMGLAYLGFSAEGVTAGIRGSWPF